MVFTSTLRKLVVAAALVAAPSASFAGVFISVGFAPPVLPVYTQPLCPGDGYIWTPGYWGYGPEGGYYWVPGVWVQPPTVGYLWTPGYWGFFGGQYRFNEGYWGPHVGYYGGVNYGFGYGGFGFEGGYWNNNHFFYNRSVSNLGGGRGFGNVYERNVTVINNTRVSYNGGQGGVQYRARPEELQAGREQHVQPTQNQAQFRQAASTNRAQFASANGGRPGVTAAPTTRDGFGHGNEVNARQGNQQQRISNGVNSGQMTPGETRNVENRDASINRQANADRAANGGNLTNNQRQQINQRQNNVSNSIYQDKHNSNTDAAAAARQGRQPGQVQGQAQQVQQRTQPQQQYQQQRTQPQQQYQQQRNQPQVQQQQRTQPQVQQQQRTQPQQQQRTQPQAQQQQARPQGEQHGGGGGERGEGKPRR